MPLRYCSDCEKTEKVAGMKKNTLFPLVISGFCVILSECNSVNVQEQDYGRKIY